jgi:PKD repeat protein
MHRSWKVAVLTALSVAAIGILPIVAGDATPSVVPHGPTHWLPDHNWSGQFCRYPGANTKRLAPRLGAVIRPIQVAEVEPNDQYATAQILTLGPTPTDPVDLDVIGAVATGDDVDLYRFTANKGDVIGLAVLSKSALDPVVAIQQSSGTSLIENDNDPGIGYLYPGSSPLPSGTSTYDAALSWICPVTGEYLIKVSSFGSASRGDYVLEVRALRPSFETQNVNATQIVFLDFDGATVNAQETFNDPYARSAANLSPLRTFLPKWGLTAADEAAVVQSIVDHAQLILDNLRQPNLNGNYETDTTIGHFDVQLLNSRDHADPWGQPNVSRVVVGGTVEELGILTIGIASCIDPGNFSREDTAVVLLDYLSADKPDPNSVNSIGLASGVTTIDAIGQTVATVVVHEMGHYIGNWHTDNADEIPCIMDTGGNEIWIAIGAGPDATLGTGDDQLIEFTQDAFDPYEMVAVGDEMTDVNSAFALSTGMVSNTLPPDPITPPTYPAASVRATPTAGSPPLAVEFSAGAANNAGDVVFKWDFADGSPTEFGPVVNHVFTTPGEFLVKVTTIDSQNATGKASVLVTVSAQLPTAKVAASPTRGPAPLTVQFDGRGSTTASTDIVPASYEWNFGDNKTGTGATVSHTYSRGGYYVATLKFTDSAGGSSTATALITVTGSAASTSLDSAQNIPSTQASPQCGLGGGVMMVSSLAGLLALMRVRRRGM